MKLLILKRISLFVISLKKTFERFGGEKFKISSINLPFYRPIILGYSNCLRNQAAGATQTIPIKSADCWQLGVPTISLRKLLACQNWVVQSLNCVVYLQALFKLERNLEIYPANIAYAHNDRCKQFVSGEPKLTFAIRKSTADQYRQCIVYCLIIWPNCYDFRSRFVFG